MKRRRFAAPAVLALAPTVAHAQYIPAWAAAAAVSPLLVFILAALLGYLARSWRTDAAHAGLVVVWVVSFILAAQLVDSDYVWTPSVLYAAHAVVIVALIVRSAARRLRGRARKPHPS